MADQSHVRQLIETIDDNSWIIGGKLLLARQASSAGKDGCHCHWSDGDGSFYVLSNAPHPLPPSRPLSPASTVQQVYEAGDRAAVWRAGDAFLKVRDLDPYKLRSTREHVTLRALHERGGGNLSFAVPRCLYHALWDLRYFLVLSAVPGETLDVAWPTMKEEQKQYYVDRVASICRELGEWEADYIGGVDRKELSDRFMKQRDGPDDYSHRTLVANCIEVGMDCTGSFRFYHCDLGPQNLIIHTADQSIGIIDWETAGFVPAAWIRTKFHISSGMDLTQQPVVAANPYPGWDWRVRVGRKLGAEGFPEVADEWLEWWKASDT
ncbi:hypothetical protein F4778DRAFT_94713 [Xylariomycetidae sp. FL2044]|nr:hypothetical protein F4778DRAFT_94713 [Xylariomycetidae sp. FL2044]